MKEMKKLPCYCQETRHSAPDPCKCISYHIQYATQYMQEKNNGVVVQLYDQEGHMYGQRVKRQCKEEYRPPAVGEKEEHGGKKEGKKKKQKIAK